MNKHIQIANILLKTVNLYIKKTGSIDAENFSSVLKIAISEDKIPELLNKFYVEVLKFANLQKEYIKAEDIKAFDYKIENNLFEKFSAESKKVYSELNDNEKKDLWKNFKQLINLIIDLHL